MGNRLAVLTAATALGMVIMPAPAGADTYPDPGWWLNDRGEHSYCWNLSFPDDLKGNAAAAENNMENQTIVNTTSYSDCNFTVRPHTDVIWETSDLGGLSYAQTTCHKEWSNGNCDVWRIELDADLIRADHSATLDEYAITFNACHELGHTVSVQHHDIEDPGFWGCMTNGVLPNLNVDYRRYVEDHVDHIDGYF